MMTDCIVIGGGVVGSSAAYHLAGEGKQTVLIEQFPLPHTRGSSHGPTRIIRTSYTNVLYSKMTVEAFHLWHRLEEETKCKLYRKTGMLVIDKPPFSTLEEAKKTALVSGGECVELSPADVQQLYPGLVTIPSGHRAFLEKGAGTLKADKALACLREQIKKFGGRIQDGEKVERIIPGKVVTVITNQATYQAKSLIIACGAWTRQVLQALCVNVPLKVVRTTVCFWKEPNEGQSEGFPIFCDYGIHPPKHFTLPCFVYGFPSIEYPGLRKLGIHQGIETHPDVRDEVCLDNTDSTSDMSFLFNYMKTRLPECGDKPSIVENCMYSMTPDEDFIVDTLPHHPNISFGCGFSGHGFKMAPVLGRILGELALGRKVSYDISCLSLKRFPGAINVSKY